METFDSAAAVDRLLYPGRIPPAVHDENSGCPANCPCGEPVEYEMNSLGYRSPEFTIGAEFKIAVFGCETVFGEGLCGGHLFHAHVRDAICRRTGRTAEVFNLGIRGAANDTIMRVASMAVPVLKPDLVLINFTQASRREYLRADGKVYLFDPRRPPADLVEREIKRHFMTLANPCADAVNFCRNHTTIGRILAPLRWFWCASEAWVVEELGSRLDLSCFAGAFTRLDPAGGEKPSGPESHRRLAERFIEMLDLSYAARA